MAHALNILQALPSFSANDTLSWGKSVKVAATDTHTRTHTYIHTRTCTNTYMYICTRLHNSCCHDSFPCYCTFFRRCHQYFVLSTPRLSLCFCLLLRSIPNRNGANSLSCICTQVRHCAAVLWTNRAAAHLMLGQYKAALADCQKVSWCVLRDKK